MYAQTVTTALTAQNTLGVEDVHITPPEFVAKQIDTCMSDIGCDVVKIGMLASAATVEAVADRLEKWSVSRVVLDPVMVSTSGAQLLPPEAVETVLAKLVRGVEIVTPNVPEAVLMLKEGSNDHDHAKTPDNLEDLKSLAVSLHTKFGPKAVLLKGGHLPMNRRQDGSLSKPGNYSPEIVVDVLYDGIDFELIESPYSHSRNTHGTGCSLASAIAARLAQGHSLKKAVKQACQYIAVGIRTSTTFSKGPGPLNHFHNVQLMPFVEGKFLEYLLERPDVEPVWQAYTNHTFANQMGDGTLPVEAFRDYLVQDYLYLTHFARTNALAAYKSQSMDSIVASAQIVLHIETEMKLHLEYCKEFGLSKSEILKHKESLACVAYSRYVLDIGQSQDWLALQMSLAPCLLGYGVAATRLAAQHGNNHEGNRYWKWIENYIADDYREAVKIGSGKIYGIVNLVPTDYSQS